VAAGAQRSSCTAPSHRLLTQIAAAPLVASGFERKRKTRFAYAARVQHLAATAALVEKRSTVEFFLPMTRSSHHDFFGRRLREKEWF